MLTWPFSSNMDKSDIERLLGGARPAGGAAGATNRCCGRDMNPPNHSISGCEWRMMILNTLHFYVSYPLGALGLGLSQIPDCPSWLYQSIAWGCGIAALAQALLFLLWTIGGGCHTHCCSDWLNCLCGHRCPPCETETYVESKPDGSRYCCDWSNLSVIFFTVGAIALCGVTVWICINPHRSQQTYPLLQSPSGENVFCVRVL